LHNLAGGFASDVLHYKRPVQDANGTEQEKAVMDSMRYSEPFAMIVFPHISLAVRQSMPSDFLDIATRVKQPVAAVESGM